MGETETKKLVKEVAREIVDTLAIISVTRFQRGVVASSLKWNVAESSRNGEDIPSACTDGIEVIINPNFWRDKLQNSKLREFVCLHEIDHVLRKHSIRKCGRDHMLWNVAADFEINCSIAQDGGSFPLGALIDSKYNGLSAETIYEMLKSSGGSVNYVYSDEPGSGGDLVLDLPEGMTRAQVKQIEETIDKIIQMSGVTAGNIPGSSDRDSIDIQCDVVDWRSYLEQWVREKISEDRDYSWKRPNKRYWPEIYIPGIVRDEEFEIAGVIAFDTSGSVWGELLDKFTSNLSRILGSYGKVDLVFYQCDHAIQEKKELTNNDLPIHVELKGGGGTSFEPVFSDVASNDVPDFLIYFTDLEGEFPDFVPPYPVLWVVYGGSRVIPPFGNVIHLS